METTITCGPHKSEPCIDKSANECGSKSANNDPYAYLNRNGFSSENFKIEIRNLPRHYGIKELKKLLNTKLSLKLIKLKTPSPRGSRVYACFKTVSDRQRAIEILNGFKWKGCCLAAHEAKPMPDPLVQKRNAIMVREQEDSGRKLKLNENELGEKIKDATTPLWRIPYSKQLEKKTKTIKNILKEYAYKLVATNPDLTDWWRSQKEQHNDLPCQLLPIRFSDLINGYRNKCEFSIGINEVTGERTIGFRLGSYVKGSTAVAPVHDLPNVPDRMKVVVEVFQKFIQQSLYDVYNSESQEGYWKQFTVRLGFRTNALMAIIGLDPQQMTETDLNSLKMQIKQFFTDGEGSSCRVDSLYLLIMKRRLSQQDEPVYEHVLGETHITETLLGKTFRISPQAFFQVNTNAAEILYESIAEVASLSGNVSLLDVCCGTGSIGICLSERCGQVLGLEKSTEAIADAKANAQMNNTNNTEFYAGKAEEILTCVAHKASTEEIVAVVDPPRAGLEHDALVQIRKCERIKKLVYVSCDPGRVTKNLVDLGRAPSKIYRKQPFLPVLAIPVDLFPHTEHCELVIYLERLATDVE